MEERVKIITPGTCDYFRKVLIPSSLGDDTGDYAPKNGDYKNAIVEYAKNHHVYIYSSDGIPTNINVYNMNQNFVDLFGITPDINERKEITEEQYNSVIKFFTNYNWGNEVYIHVALSNDFFNLKVSGVIYENNSLYMIAYPFVFSLYQDGDDNKYYIEGLGI